MESVVEAHDPADRAHLRVALEELAEQDPFIKVRHDAVLNETTVSLYGEVQREVIQSTLATTTGSMSNSARRRRCISNALSVGRSCRAADFRCESLHGYRRTPGRTWPRCIRLGFPHSMSNRRSVPLYIYKTEGLFIDHMTEYIRRALGRGPYGWEVTDSVVTLTRCDYYVSDGPAKPTLPMARTTSADFRKLTPRGARSGARAGWHLCLRTGVTSQHRVAFESVWGLLNAIANSVASSTRPGYGVDFSTVEATMPADRSRDLQRQLPGLTGGEGNLESIFDGYQPVSGKPPIRSKVARRRPSS